MQNFAIYQQALWFSCLFRNTWNVHRDGLWIATFYSEELAKDYVGQHRPSIDADGKVAGPLLVTKNRSFLSRKAHAWSAYKVGVGANIYWVASFNAGDAIREFSGMYDARSIPILD